MNVASVMMFVVGLFGLVLIALGLLSVGQDGNMPFFGIKFGGWFLFTVGIFIAGGAWVGFFRMLRR
jgi:hypothetical protein